MIKNKFLNRKDIFNALFLGLIHLIMAIFYVFVAGISIVVDPTRNLWDWFWQSIPVELLQKDFLRSIWYLHAQPPFYNFLIGLFVKLFFPYHLQTLHLFNITLGSLLSGMSYAIIVQIISNRSITLLLSFIITINPSLFLYEAYMLYSLFCAFLIVLSIFFLSWYYKDRSSWLLYGFIVSMTILVMTRSLYYILLLCVVLVFVFMISNLAKRKHNLIISILITLIAFGWCARNYTLYGFFGTSSWYGMGLWNIAAHRYTLDELQVLEKTGILDPVVVETRVFSMPSTYYVYNFNKKSSIEVLSRDNLNNINIPDISKVYARNSLRLILHQPSRYLQSIYESYLMFCKPSSRFKHLPLNAAKIEPHESFYADILQGRNLMSQGTSDYGSFLFFLLPTSLLTYLFTAFFKIKQHKSLILFIQEDMIMFWCFIIITYVVFVSCTVEFGEQDRFKFNIEQLLWFFIPIVLFRGIYWPIMFLRRKLNFTSHS
ncbi:hypothetical protein OSCT_0732 [Oscillochloris trichoides DG-6]|uniref:Glycosyltransferase RgtA/B/C/D-like domain-containing protein n=1 Tax=Oscillochloris trichoides DG-6 TaxID=765420 RepID=E1IBN1_9CHLR|nr:hypothetical protein [Oscillochloris trichoides]EFO81450.1 hypothetical protein OSCT_0732 [Oscillochloris trichoides DG-6]